MNHDEFDYKNYKHKNDEWLDYVENEVFCTAFRYARYCRSMEEITAFSMEGCLSPPGLGWKYFNGLRDENDEPIYTYNDNYMRWLVHQSRKGGRVCVFSQYYKGKICDDVLIILSEEVKVEGNVDDIKEAYMKYENEHWKIFKEEYESKFFDYRDIDEEEMINYINKNLGEFPIHKLFQQLTFNNLLWDFDGNKIYPSAMSDPKSFYPRKETGYTYTEDMNDELVEKLNNQTFTQESAILKINYYNPKTLIVQQIPIKEKKENIS